MDPTSSGSLSREQLLQLVVAYLADGNRSAVSGEQTDPTNESPAEDWRQELRHMAGWGVKGIRVY